MKFGKNFKLILTLLYVATIILNLVLYFYIKDTAVIFGKEINVIYIQIAYILIEGLVLSAVYGKKQGLTVCLGLALIIVLNIRFLIVNLLLL